MNAADSLIVQLGEIEMEEETVLDAVHLDSSMVLVTTHGLRAYSDTLGPNEWTVDYPVAKHVLGLPIFHETIALFFSYRGKGKYGPDESGDALLTAIRLTDGETLWSAHLPGYLPLERTLDGDRAYLTCQRIGKPLDVKGVERTWRIPMEERPDTWILALDLTSGELLWHAKTKYWASYLGTIDEAVYFAEQVGSGSSQKTPLVKRDKLTGKMIWRAEAGLDRTNYQEVREHPRGVAAFSTGEDGTISHLFHNLSGEIMGRLSEPMRFRALHGDTLYVLGAGESFGYSRKLRYTAIQWNGFTPIAQETIDWSEKVRGAEWYRDDGVEQALDSDLGYWAATVRQLPRGKRPAFALSEQTTGPVLLLPDVSPASTARTVVALDNGFLFTMRDREGMTHWGLVPRLVTNTPRFRAKRRTLQDPVLSGALVQGRFVTAYEKGVLSLDPVSGQLTTISSSTPDFALGVFARGDEVLAVTVRGVDRFGPKPPDPEPDPEPVIDEPVIAVAPQPLPVAQPVVTPPAPVEPVKRERLVKGYRVQLMYLARTPLSRIEQLAEGLERELGQEVLVQGQGSGYVVLAGAFENISDARKVMKTIRSSGHADAFLVKSTWTVTE
ncbi:SPOR domain-containing protein [bacterium]|nr:SPOR domain-containing protein [bacterium]